MFFYFRANKQSILNKAIAELSAALHAPVHIEDIEVSLLKRFPNIEVELQALSVTDSLIAIHQHPLFEAARAHIVMNPYTLVFGNISIASVALQDGSIFLYTDSTGRTNRSVLSSAHASKTTTSFPIKQLQLKRFALAAVDEQKGKDFRFFVHQLKANIHDAADSLSVQLNQKILVDAFTFNQEKGSFIKGQILQTSCKLSYHKSRSQLVVQPAEWQIGHTPFTIAAQFTFSGDPVFSIDFSTTSIVYDTIGRLVTPGIARALNHASLSSTLSCQARIAGPLNGGEPLINISWKTSSALFKTPVMDFDSTSFAGSFSNQHDPVKPRHDSNSIIVLKNFRGRFANIPLRADSIVFQNLTSPRLGLRFLSQFNLSDLNEELATSLIAFKQGIGNLDLSFNGPIENMSRSNTLLSGNLHFNDGVLSFTPLDIAMTNCKGNIDIDHGDLYIREISCSTTYRQPLSIRGEAINVIAAFNRLPERMLLNLQLQSPFLNMDGISALLSGQQIQKPGKRKGFIASAVRIDQLLERGTVTLGIKTDRLQHGRMEATAVNIQAMLRERNWSLKNMTMLHSGGQIQVTGDIQRQEKGRFLLHTQANVKKINARKLFYSFNNFGQTGIQDHHIDGNLSFLAKLTIPLSGRGELDASGTNGSVDFLFADGRLLAYKPLEKLKAFIFKNRNFSDVRFATLRDRMEIENGIVSIKRMYIESTVLTMYLSGRYDLRGNETDLSVQLPLRNINKRDSAYVLAQPTERGGGGLSIYLRAKSQQDGSISLRYDPLGRFRKKH